MKAQQEGRLTDAETILQNAINTVATGEPNSHQPATYLRNLAMVYRLKHQYADAIAANQRALELDQAEFGAAGAPAVADLNGIATILEEQGEKDQAEQTFKRVIELTRQSSQPDPIRLAAELAELASFYLDAHRVAEAQPLLEEAVKNCDSPPSAPPAPLCETFRHMLADLDRDQGRPFHPAQLPPVDPTTPPVLARLQKSAQQYTQDGLYVQAEIADRQVIAWIDQNPKTETPGPPRTVYSHLGLLPTEYRLLGQMLEKQGRNDEAEESYKKAIELQETDIDPKHPLAISAFNFSDLMNFYRSRDRLSEIDPIITHAIELQEKFLGENSIRVADTLVTLAGVYSDEGKTNPSKYADGVPLFQRALKIQETNLGPENPQLLRTLTGYASVLRSMHQDAEAAALQGRINAIQKDAQSQRQRN